ncbi:MAG: tetratricopeptide repeat protein, partial [Gammaproteobacteria bacterium]|nr:tetratricopeptide repeat protein [Gammaproteobacteria bacterium]
MNVISRMTSDYQQRSSERESSSVKSTPHKNKFQKSAKKIRLPYILASLLSLVIIGLTALQFANTPDKQHKTQQNTVDQTKSTGEPESIQSRFKEKTVVIQKSHTDNNTNQRSVEGKQHTKETSAKNIESLKPLAQKNPPTAVTTARKQLTSRTPIEKSPTVVINKQTTKTRPPAPNKTSPPTTKSQEKAKIQPTQRYEPDSILDTVQNENKGEIHKTINSLSNPQLAQQTFIAAIKLLKRKEFRKSEEYLTTALGFDPQHIQARETLAGLYISRKQHDKAISLLAEGMSRNPEYTKFRLLLAQTYIDIDNEGQALTTLLDSPAEHKTTGQYHSMIAAIQQNLGMYKDAI